MGGTINRSNRAIEHQFISYPMMGWLWLEWWCLGMQDEWYLMSSHATCDWFKVHLLANEIHDERPKRMKQQNPRWGRKKTNSIPDWCVGWEEEEKKLEWIAMERVQEEEEDDKESMSSRKLNKLLFSSPETNQIQRSALHQYMMCYYWLCNSCFRIEVSFGDAIATFLLTHPFSLYTCTFVLNLSAANYSL